jgi:hypothetical protein
MMRGDAIHRGGAKDQIRETETEERQVQKKAQNLDCGWARNRKTKSFINDGEIEDREFDMDKRCEVR